MKKLYDLCVKTGSYERDGETKGRYENVGAVMQSDDGNKFLMLKRTFNPAGVPFREGSDAILVSMFTPKERGEAAPRGGGGRAAAPSGGGGGGDFNEDSDIPFVTCQSIW